MAIRQAAVHAHVLSDYESTQGKGGAYTLPVL